MVEIPFFLQELELLLTRTKIENDAQKTDQTFRRVKDDERVQNEFLPVFYKLVYVIHLQKSCN